MADKTRVFISYKTGADTGLSFQAQTIYDRLKAEGYAPWLDTENLKAGLDWNTQIYEEIPQSDILLLLLAQETAVSDWVRREIDVAKGARTVILPVLIRADFNQQEALEKFDLPRVQFVKLLTGKDEEYKKLLEELAALKDKTRAGQVAWLKGLVEEKQEAYGRPNKSIHVYRMEDPKHATEVHLAGGDVIQMREIDVLVNSENDYLQMARIFESRTVSSLLRYYGSQIDKAQRILDDTVQNELNEKAKAEFVTRPVGLGTVVVTSAGHPDSYLRTKNEARFIFHTATVSVEGEGPNKRLEPIRDDSAVRNAVRKTLDEVKEVDKKHMRGKGKTTYKPIASILLPVFGTGHGGRSFEDVAPSTVRAVKEFLVDTAKEKPALERIHVLGYSKRNVEILAACLEEELGPPITSLPAAVAAPDPDPDA